jgi:hypothetical protein
MKIGHTIDTNGFLTGDVLEGETPDVTVMCPNGFYKPKWNGTAWVDGLTQAEIDAIKNAPVPPSEIDELKSRQADILIAMVMNNLM